MIRLRCTIAALFLGALVAHAGETAPPANSGPVVQFSPSAVNFGLVTLGHLNLATLTVTNSGNSLLTIFHDEVPITAAQFYIYADGCSGQALLPGASCEVTLSYSPQDPGSKGYDYYIIWDNASPGYQTLMMYGKCRKE
jgi:hypothetical protein